MKQPKEYKQEVVCLLHIPSGQMTPLMTTDNNTYHNVNYLGCNNTIGEGQFDNFLKALYKMHGRLSAKDFSLRIMSPQSTKTAS